MVVFKVQRTDMASGCWDPVLIDAFDATGKPVRIAVVFVAHKGPNACRIGIEAPKSIGVNRSAIVAEREGKTPTELFQEVRATHHG